MTNRACCNDQCEWVGPETDAVHPKHDFGRLFCPKCYEVTEPVEQTALATSDPEGHRQAIADAQAVAESYPPIDMVLHCPACGMQHIDEKEFDGDRVDPYPSSTGEDDPALSWDNPPHRSHLCHGCGYIWRPADVPTNGVAAVKTTGKADSPLATAAACARGAVPNERDYHAALQRVGTALGLAAGSNVLTDCVPAIEALHKASPWKKTKNEIPEFGKRVLVRRPGETVIAARMKLHGDGLGRWETEHSFSTPNYYPEWMEIPA